MDIKTDWTPDDYYNIHDDLTRTEGNIHEIAAVLSAALLHKNILLFLF